MLSPSFIFFFQAEDGIRGFHVTGVQTCALPISAALGAHEACLPARARREQQRLPVLGQLEQLAEVDAQRGGHERSRLVRSEERRVGKECRSLGSPHHVNKKVSLKEKLAGRG